MPGIEDIRDASVPPFKLRLLHTELDQPFEAVSQSAHFLLGRLAFPYDYDSPSLPTERSLRGSVTEDILFELLRPERDVRRWRKGPAAAAMPMPEATVYEDGNPCSADDEVRCPWEVRVVRSVPEAKLAQNTPDDPFWQRTLSANPRH